jgi:hypothetical protein
MSASSQHQASTGRWVRQGKTIILFNIKGNSGRALSPGELEFESGQPPTRQTVVHPTKRRPSGAQGSREKTDGQGGFIGNTGVLVFDFAPGKAALTPNQECVLMSQQVKFSRDCPDIGGSCRLGKDRVCLGDPVEPMPKPGTKRAVVDCAADLQKQIGAVARPSHLLRLVHASVHQEVRRAFGDRRSDSFSGTVSLGILISP